MLPKLLKFELSVHLRQISFWVAFAVMLGIGIAFASLENFSIGTGAGSKVKGNGAIPIALTVSAFGLFSIFFAAVFVVTGVMRDETYRFMEIIHSTKVKTIDLIVSRMLGVWIATTLSLMGIVIGTMAGQFMPWADSETFQKFNLIHYLQPTFLFIVINALLVSSIYTLIAVSTRNKALVYVSAVGLFVLYIIAGIIAGENPDEWLAALIDPFGATSLALETQYWPAAEQNSEMAPLSGWLGFNRLMYLALSVFIFSTAYMLSARGFKNGKVKNKKNENENLKIPTHIKPMRPNFGSSYSLKSFWLRIMFEYKSTVKTTAFIILFGIAIVLFGITLFASLYLGASTSLPTSNLMTQLALGSMLIPLIIIMVFFGSDLMWRDRTSNIHGIVDATPVKNSTLLFAKWGALALLILTLILGLLVAGMIAQLIFGWGIIPVVPKTFLAIGLVSFFTTFFFQGMLVMFIQNFMPSRIIGMFVGAGALISLIFVIGNLPFYHPLMNYGSIGAGAYSEMGGFSAPKSYGWEFAYWAGFLLILGAISTWIWRRGYQVSLSERLRGIKDNITRFSSSTAIIGITLFLGFGILGSQSYKAEDYVNANQVEKNRAEFEKSVIDIWEDLEPRITKVSVVADFFPENQTASFNGVYTIDNPHEETIERVTLYSAVGIENISKLKIEGGTEVTDDDISKKLKKDYDILTIKFDPPLAPGDEREVVFSTKFNGSTLTESSDIIRNGTFLNNSEALIVFGNLETQFISNPDKRRKYDLGDRVEWPDRENEEARRYHLLTSASGYADFVDFDAKICTIENQIPVAPGKFISEDISGGRRCRVYKSINPILNFFSFMTAEYELQTQTWNNPAGDNIDLEIYYHPTHNYNIELMFDSMKQALDTYTNTFSPYQYAQLRIMEFPYQSFAQAFAGTVPFSENIGFVQNPGDSDDPKRVDYASYVTMHEIGHQWFAHQLIGAFAKGSNLLSEGLTENATMLAYENHYDFTKARRMHEERTTQQYLTQRTFDNDDEPVLAKAEGQGYLNYNKTSWVFWGMRQLIGNEVVQNSVKRMLREHHGNMGAPYPTTLELVKILNEEVHPKYHKLIDDYWNKITFWELSFTSDVEISEKGKYFQVSVPITLDKKYAAEKDGEETSVTDIKGEKLNEWVEVGFYLENPEADLGANPFEVKLVQLSKSETMMKFNLEEKPKYIVLDPKRALIERNVKDNTKSVI